ncbi:MAG: hypothetical protein ACOX4B_02665 [Bacillota bacterium]
MFREIDPGFTDAYRRPVIFQGLLAAAPHVFEITLLKHHSKLSESAFYEELGVLRDNLGKARMSRPGRSPSKFRDAILEAFTKGTIKPTVIAQE